MLRKKNYVYGDESMQLHAHVHFGKEMLDNMMKYRDIVALINAETGEQLTYGELAQQVIDIALSLTHLGVKKGDVISICSEKRFEVMATMLGITCAGATYSPTDPTYGPTPLLHRLKISKPKVMFCSAHGYDDHKATFEKAGSIETYILYDTERRDGTISFNQFLTKTATYEEFFPTPVDGWVDRHSIIFSSGTTGLPKGVPMTHANVLIFSKYLSNETLLGMAILNTREWYYTYGMMHTLSCMRGGATIVFPTKHEESDYLEVIQKYKTPLLQISPSNATQFSKSQIIEKYDVSSVQYVLCSSTPIMGEQINALKHVFTNLRDVVQLYGTTEAGVPCSTMNAPKGSKPGSVGVISPSYIIKVVDLHTRSPLGPNERGEICVKSPAVLREYICANTTDYMDKEGFFKTGDVGYYDDDKYFYVVNRIKELIKFNDISVSIGTSW
ncbi:hypothetical protein O3G_MSEX015450 [Manduca sexta]|uniref:AMP-dependent synthetase/ligase domain-containing protein n=1 Tax=Manduca sexta TaxID=7130 RepID=A0A922A146_MANSE|nr:hypothetical protein O3G_MSEX015450 [Manduca sexta]